MSEKTKKAVDKFLNHIFSDDKLLICVVCKEKIEGEHNLDRNIILSNHINARKHKKNVRTLFKLCIPDWIGGHANIVKNLVLDVNFERNESNFILKTSNNSFDCLVCQENIAQSTGADGLTKSIIKHIRADLHNSNLKNNVSWVLPLDDQLAFIMFHKSAVYCSICKLNVQSAITCPLNKAVEHLKVYHDNKYKTLIEELKSDSSAEEESICQSLKYLTISDDKSTKAVTCPSHKNLDSHPELSLVNCDSVANGSEDFDGSDDSDEENSDGSIDICLDDLTCPECGELIEIYNENAGFSMDVHIQKHKPLMSVYTESEFDYQDNVDYVCPVCQETIAIFNKSLEFSIDRHFEEKRHEHERFTLDDCGDKNRFDFLSTVFDGLPENLRNQKSFFVMDGNKVFCKLCNCIVSTNKNVPYACKVFFDHMSSTFHVHQFKSSSNFLFMAVVNYNKQSLSQVNTKELDKAVKNICKKNLIIESNKHFIEKRQTHYCCVLCNKQISYSPKENIQTLNFILHLVGNKHKNALKKVTKKKEVKAIISQLSKKRSPVKLNRHFIKEKGGDFFCKICKVQVKFSKTGFDLEEHCASSLHNTQLSERGFLYVSKLEYKKLTEKHALVLNSVTTAISLQPHAHFINHNGENFCCIICNVSIHGSTSTGKNVKKHFYSAKHRKKHFKVICSQAKIRSQKSVERRLKYLVLFDRIIRKYAHLIDAKDGHFFCKICKEYIVCTCSGLQLKEHFKHIKHRLRKTSGVIQN